VQNGTVTFRVRGVRSWATPYTKPGPSVDVLGIGKNAIEGSPVDRPARHTPNEVHRVARVNSRMLPLVRRTCIKLAYTTEGPHRCSSDRVALELPAGPHVSGPAQSASDGVPLGAGINMSHGLTHPATIARRVRTTSVICR
jgi:hypothetical protein